MKQPTYYTLLPPQIRFDQHLSPNAKLLYGEIKALCDQQGYCWASNQYFAGLYGVEKKAVSRWIHQLDMQGYLRLETGKAQGNRRRIYLQSSPSERGEISSEMNIAHPISKEGYPPKRTGEEPPLLIDNFIDNKDRIYSASPLKGRVISRDREKTVNTEENDLKYGSSDDQSFPCQRLGIPHPPVALPPLPQKRMKQSFVKPSVKEAEDYMLGQKELCPNALTARTQALRFVNYYESNGWKVGRNAMRDWRAAANNWLLNAQDYADKASKKLRNDITSPDFDPYAPRLHSGGPKDYSIPL